MQTLRQKLSQFITWWRTRSLRKKIALVAVLFVALYIVFNKGGSDTTATIETVKRQDLVQSVSASGTVVSSTDLSLGFEQSKMVSSVSARVGAKVQKGEVLATLSNGTERAQVTSARGALLAARARYNKVIEGSSNEQIKLAQVELANAKRTLMSEDLVAKPDRSGDTIVPVISGTYTGAEGEYRLEFNKLAQNLLEYSGVERGSVRVNDTTSSKLGTKGLYVQFPAGTLEEVPSGTVWTVVIPNVEGSSYIGNKAMVDQKEASLAVTQATARQADVDAALADVVVAQAGLDSAIANLEKTILRAPADGTITAVEVKIGEIAEIGSPAVALQDVSNLYLEANVNESSIKSVAVGQTVSVTFDAFPGDTRSATVSSVDPAATIESNVVNYKIKALLSDTEKVRPGMTANMTIVTAQVPQVLVIPGRMITTVDGVATVQVVTDERKQKTASRTVTTGLRGDGDMVEIQSGLTEGERVWWIAK